jgi:deoxyribose-phosphate aldolase
MDDVPSRIEHTVLGPTTTLADVRAVLDAASEYGMRACIPPGYVADAAATVTEVPLTTVLDFPHGQGATEAVCRAAEGAVADGAAELDVVCPVGRFKAGETEAVETHLRAIVDRVSVPVKVIVESPLLEADELDRIGRLVAGTDAAYLKTATGFSDGGATVEAVERLAAHLPVKASGGIGSWRAAEAMFEAGAERIGASSGATIVQEWRAATS